MAAVSLTVHLLDRVTLESRVDVIVIMAPAQHPEQGEVLPSIKHCTHIRGRTHS